ncbi:MAG: hypothetical protein JRN26_04650 [Nitrososphaerota archaeon]|nr:hypothetical protein [Nitrososphaerota archaeon]MDG6927852.1 hypothetical protein [Nitrososphaerota archaeon]MDG6931280.1 hypothetical protein [Nitrososphaerota archaeon]MDG6932147.1 hypothetical protein [Nitrososphaerota archaeon]MDG6936154.1 hypothetical protein [Nitrososphaerota archaeon]
MANYRLRGWYDNANVKRLGTNLVSYNSYKKEQYEWSMWRIYTGRCPSTPHLDHLFWPAEYRRRLRALRKLFSE